MCVYELRAFSQVWGHIHVYIRAEMSTVCILFHTALRLSVNHSPPFWLVWVAGCSWQSTCLHPTMLQTWLAMPGVLQRCRENLNSSGLQTKVSCPLSYLRSPHQDMVYRTLHALPSAVSVSQCPKGYSLTETVPSPHASVLTPRTECLFYQQN